jgi:hypothetical protein
MQEREGEAESGGRKRGKALVHFPNRECPIWNSLLQCALNVDCSNSFVFGKNYSKFD